MRGGLTLRAESGGTGHRLLILGHYDLNLHKEHRRQVEAVHMEPSGWNVILRSRWVSLSPRRAPGSVEFESRQAIRTNKIS